MIRVPCSPRIIMSTGVRKPLVFIGSSTADAKVASEFKRVMETPKTVTVDVWMDVFRTGETILQGLFRVLDDYDFGVFLLSADELLALRDERKRRTPPRANVVLEFGLFAGRHGLERTFAAISEPAPPDLPSDLGGLVYETYEVREDNLTSGIRSAAERAAERAVQIGPRVEVSQPRPGARTAQVDATPDAWRLLARRRRLDPVDPTDLRLADEIVDPMHGWGQVVELEPGVDGELIATVAFPRVGEAKLRASRLYVANV